MVKKETTTADCEGKIRFIRLSSIKMGMESVKWYTQSVNKYSEMNGFIN